jgi:hypothetical protein
MNSLKVRGKQETGAFCCAKLVVLALPFRIGALEVFYAIGLEIP